jgi:hypothetical protein
MKTIRILLFLSILINSSFAKAEFSVEESTQCYAIGAVYGFSLKLMSDHLRKNLEEITYDDQVEFKKMDSELPKTLSLVANFTKDLRKQGISRLVKSGKNISEANSLFESKANAFKDKQLIFDKKISLSQYNQSLEDLFNDCLGKFKKELRKNY